MSARLVAILVLAMIFAVGVRGEGGTLGSPEGDVPPAKRYTLDELELLAQKKAWAEVLLHAEDIYPSERKKNWENVVESAAAEHLREISGAGMSGAAPVAQQLVRTYPFLSRSKSFREARGDAALSDYTLCTGINQKGDDCVSRLWDFLQGEKDDTELAFRAAKAVSQKQDPVAALPFFGLAIEGSVASRKDAYCADPDARQAVLFGLRLAPGDSSRQATILADEECWKALRAEIESAFDKEADGNFLKNTCPLLRKRKLLGKTRARKCPKTGL